MSVAIELAIEGDGWAALPDAAALVRRAIAAAREACDLELAPEAEISVLLCDDTAIRTLNRDWRGIDKATNVLSFPTAVPDALEERPLLGDIAIAWETCRREASEEDKTLADHVSHLAIHGFLHIVGFDHETAAEADEMEALEVEILGVLGIADPYAGTDPAESHAP